MTQRSSAILSTLEKKKNQPSVTRAGQNRTNQENKGRRSGPCCRVTSEPGAGPRMTECEKNTKVRL